MARAGWRPRPPAQSAAIVRCQNFRLDIKRRQLRYFARSYGRPIAGKKKDGRAGERHSRGGALRPWGRRSLHGGVCEGRKARRPVPACVAMEVGNKHAGSSGKAIRINLRRSLVGAAAGRRAARDDAHGRVLRCNPCGNNHNRPFLSDAEGDDLVRDEEYSSGAKFESGFGGISQHCSLDLGLGRGVGRGRSMTSVPLTCGVRRGKRGRSGAAGSRPRSA